MKRRVAIALLSAFALAMALMLGACASNGESAANSAASGEASSAASSSAAAPGEYSGTLVIAYQHELVLSGEDGEMEFATSDDTTYDMGDVGAMYLDDILSVKYHKDGNTNYADEVALVEHMDTALEFAGKLVDFDNSHITLAGESLTVNFQIDSDSYIVGDLSQGDEIELTYLGDINEYPYANVVAVVTEAETPKTNVVHGVISELSSGTLLLSIDSAHAYRFTIASNTEIGGAATDLAIGDQVDITYQGNMQDQPTAQSVRVVKKSQGRVYVINGTIEDASGNSVVLNTGSASYAFTTTSSTKFYGEKPANGYLAKITYTGDIYDKPEAVIVYCAKSAKDANKVTAKKQDAKPANVSSISANANNSAQSGVNGGTAIDSSTKKSESKSEAAPASEPAKSESATPETQESTDEASESDSNAAVEPETQDQSGEAVEPEPEPEGQSDEAVEPEPAGEGEGEAAVEGEGEGEEVAPEPEAEVEDETAAEVEEEVAPEPEEEAAPEAEAEDEAAAEAEEEAVDEPASEMVVSGKGTIVKGDEKKKTIEIEMKNGKKLTFKYDENTKISSGYIPEKGDIVKIEYGSDSMILEDIQLVNRPAESDAEQAAESADEKSDESANEE